MNPVSTLEDAVDGVRRSTPAGVASTRVVGIDGGGGAGKTTIAEQLAMLLDGSPVVHTDDFASWEDQFDWWPRLLDQVLRPLIEGDRARYQRYDWETRGLADWVELPVQPPYVIVEGVSALRREFEPFLSYGIWVESPRAVRLRRGLDRDGEHARDLWNEWMAAEDRYVTEHRPHERADAVLSGTT